MNLGILANYFALDQQNDSGLAQHYRILADALIHRGHRVHVVHPTTDAAKARRALAQLDVGWSCEIVPVSPSPWVLSLLRRSWPGQLLFTHVCLARAAAPALAAAARSREIAVVETHAFNGPAFFFLGRPHPAVVLTRVSTTQGQMNAISDLHSRVQRCAAAWERAATRRSDALVTHNLQHRDEVCAAEGYDAAKFSIVPHGIPDPGEPSDRPSDAEAPVEFLFVGRFESRKGIDVLLAAIPQVAEANPRARFVLAGSLGDGIAWRDFAAQRPDLVETRVRTLGRVSDRQLKELYRRCSIMVAPSRYESFGLIYVEAMSHAKPVIGCLVGGIPAVVTDGVTGLLAKAGDPASLAAAMNRLAGDAALRARMGSAGRRDFLARFSADAMAVKSAELYAELAPPKASRLSSR